MTTTNWTESDLAAQFHYASNNGWLPFFDAAAAAHNLIPELLMAIASRETNMRNIKGDLHNGIYHGYGIMQVDIGVDPLFCHAWTPSAVQASIDRGTEILAGNRDYLAKHHITDLHSLAASYNTGEGNVCHSVTLNRPVDSTTSGADYGADVLRRMDVFKKLRMPLPSVAA